MRFAAEVLLPAKVFDDMHSTDDLRMRLGLHNLASEMVDLVGDALVDGEDDSKVEVGDSHADLERKAPESVEIQDRTLLP